MASSSSSGISELGCLGTPKPPRVAGVEVSNTSPKAECAKQCESDSSPIFALSNFPALFKIYCWCGLLPGDLVSPGSGVCQQCSPQTVDVCGVAFNTAAWTSFISYVYKRDSSGDPQISLPQQPVNPTNNSPSTASAAPTITPQNPNPSVDTPAGPSNLPPSSSLVGDSTLVTISSPSSPLGPSQSVMGQTNQPSTPSSPGPGSNPSTPSQPRPQPDSDSPLIPATAPIDSGNATSGSPSIAIILAPVLGTIILSSFLVAFVLRKRRRAINPIKSDLLGGSASRFEGGQIGPGGEFPMYELEDGDERAEEVIATRTGVDRDEGGSSDDMGDRTVMGSMVEGGLERVNVDITRQTDFREVPDREDRIYRSRGDQMQAVERDANVLMLDAHRDIPGNLRISSVQNQSMMRSIETRHENQERALTEWPFLEFQRSIQTNLYPTPIQHHLQFNDASFPFNGTTFPINNAPRQHSDRFQISSHAGISNDNPFQQQGDSGALSSSKRPLSKPGPTSRKQSSNQSNLQWHGFNEGDYVGLAKRRHSESDMSRKNHGKLRGRFSLDDGLVDSSQQPRKKKKEKGVDNSSRLDHSVPSNSHRQDTQTSTTSSWPQPSLISPSAAERMAQVSTWTGAEVMAALLATGMDATVVDILWRHNTTGHGLILLTDGTLESMGISSLEARRQILDTVDRLVMVPAEMELATVGPSSGGGLPGYYSTQGPPL
ncbi:hypothetical protein HDU97_010045 [Phlyctochytrium planicorne]|nr:hypothetical protein HDU97_010045 [Phlyctochytrium planicorne]